MGSQTAPKEDHRRALNVLELVLELEPALRRAYLENLGRHEAEVQQQVLALLRALGGQAPDGEATAAEARLTSLAMPARVGPYKVLREIGRGGMSRVYLAQRADAEFERQVALKVIDQGLEAPIVHQRFLAERQILASFDCPQIAKLYDGGTLANGRPYLVMELVEGVRADHFCAERRLGLGERLQLFRKICGAVGYAHQKLVVHRDLKPSNILVRADGEPKLLDFGIAKLLDPQSFPFPISEHTVSLYRPMTPSYASPEQLLGEPITTATDVYALGVLLFQLLTGAVPHASQDRLQQVLRERAGEDAPPKPSESLRGAAAAKTWAGHDRRRLVRQLRGDLDNIVAKALRPRPADRYASVAEMDEDLRRYLAGEPVRATRETPLYLAGKFVNRYRLPVGAAVVLLALLLTFAVVTQRQAHRIAEERDRADEIRGFLASLIGTADSQSRRSGGLSLKELLDENLERLKRLPFHDPQTQFELLELIGNAYRSLELSHNAVEVYRLALRQRGRSDAERARVLLELGQAAGECGQIGESLAALNEALFLAPQAGLGTSSRAYAQFVGAQLAQADFAPAARNLRLALTLLEAQPSLEGGEPLALLLQNRLILAYTTSPEPAILAAARDDLLKALSAARKKGFAAATPWTVLGRAYALLGDAESALQSHRVVFDLIREGHGYGLHRTHSAELFAESLLRRRRGEDARIAIAAARRAAREMIDLEPRSPRSRYQLAQVEAREGEILLALGRGEEATRALREAIEKLEPMAREDGTIFAKNSLARAYLLAGRRAEARPVIEELLEKGWRRADLIALAKARGALPDPLPLPLELDLELPPKIRAYLQNLPAAPPPWEKEPDLPTIEEILSAEAARIG